MGKINNDKVVTDEGAKLSSPVVFGVQLPANQVRDAIKSSVSAGKITEADGEIVYWLYNYAQDKRLSWKLLAEKMKNTVSSATISGIIRGNYAAEDWSGPIKAIKLFHDRVLEEEKNLDIGFVQTDIARQIIHACDGALNHSMPAFIYGASQLGKTTALLEFQRTHNHGRTKYLYVGSGWSKARFVREFARACKCFSEHAKGAVLEDRILDSLNKFNLVIIDEFHHAIETTTELASKEIMEYIREVFDRTGCGLVMSSTKVGIGALEDGKNRMLFDQLRRRGVVKIVLPDVPAVKDLNAVARSFMLDIPTGPTLDLIKRLVRRLGFGDYIKYLQDAYRLAQNKKQQLSWDHFHRVCEIYASYANQKAEY